jgi:hypothetical protein
VVVWDVIQHMMRDSTDCQAMNHRVVRQRSFDMYAKVLGEESRADPNRWLSLCDDVRLKSSSA